MATGTNIRTYFEGGWHDGDAAKNDEPTVQTIAAPRATPERERPGGAHSSSVRSRTLDHALCLVLPLPAFVSPRKPGFGLAVTARCYSYSRLRRLLVVFLIR